VVRRELYVNPLVEAQSHHVVPTRNGKVIGSIPTGGFTSDRRRRWPGSLVPKPSWCEWPYLRRWPRRSPKATGSRGEIETLPSGAAGRGQSG
jgi:hypothetical protein